MILITKKRTGFTKDNIFNKKKYANIFNLIVWARTQNKKIKFEHLRYALCKNHGLSLDYKKEKELKEFFYHDEELKNKLVKKAENMHDAGLVNRKFIDITRVNIAQDQLHNMRRLGLLSNKNKFDNYHTLANAISRMKKIVIISSCPDKKGYPYYMVTKKGLESFDRWFIMWYISTYCPSSKLGDLRENLMYSF